MVSKIWGSAKKLCIKIWLGQWRAADAWYLPTPGRIHMILRFKCLSRPSLHVTVAIFWVAWRTSGRYQAERDRSNSSFKSYSAWWRINCDQVVKLEGESGIRQKQEEYLWGFCNNLGKSWWGLGIRCEDHPEEMWLDSGFYDVAGDPYCFGFC